MARYHFPGKPAKCSLRVRSRNKRVLSSRLSFARDRLKVAENTGLWLQVFHALQPEEDEYEEFRGFTEREIRQSRDRYEELAREGDACRAELWAARGVMLVPKERDRIRQHAAQVLRSVLQITPSSQQPPPPVFTPATSAATSTPITSHKFKLPHPVPKRSSKPAAKPELSRRKTIRSAADPYLVRDRSERARQRAPILDRIIVDRDMDLLRGMDVKTMRIRRKKAREIQIPGWRPVNSGGGGGDAGTGMSAYSAGMASPEEEEEETSDAIYIARHAKAEAEEQDLWDKWQTIRRRAGKSGGGRSQSQAWRQVLSHHNHQAATRIRSDRLDSLESECSSGRASPSLMDSLREICVATEPPSPEPAGQNSPPSTGQQQQQPLDSDHTSVPLSGRQQLASPCALNRETVTDSCDRTEKEWDSGDNASALELLPVPADPDRCDTLSSALAIGVSAGSPLAKADLASERKMSNLLDASGCATSDSCISTAPLPHWLLSPVRVAGTRNSGSSSSSGHGLLAVSPPKLGAGHLAYKLYRKCSPAASFCNDCGQAVRSATDPRLDCAPAWLANIVASPSLKKKHMGRRKSQLCCCSNIAAALLKRSRSTMRGKEVSLPLLNSSTSTTSVAKENCDQRVTAVAAFAAVRPEEEQLDAVPDSSSGEEAAAAAISRVLKDRNAEKESSEETWKRQRPKSFSSTASSSPQRHHNNLHTGRDYPLRSQSLTRRTRQGCRR